MKQIILFLIIILCLSGCSLDPESYEDPNNDSDNEIRVINSETIGGTNYRILIIEGHKYITVSSHGIIHAETCSCKSNNQK
jgi:hypothetical protein